MIISIASGKGGTGKTTVAINLALALGREIQLADCDVEEPNAHLFIHPVFEDSRVVATPVPEVDTEKCTLCGKCSDICQFKAIIIIGETSLAFPELCHSCGGCWEVCPEDAIRQMDRELGVIERGRRDSVRFMHGRLRIGEAMAPPLIRAVRAALDPDLPAIIDAPPGTSCPVIAAVKDTDFVLLVTEPTPFGVHDLQLAVETVRILGIPAGLVINRSDIGNDEAWRLAEREHLPVLMEIPFDRRIAEAYSEGQPLIEALPEWKGRFQDLYARIETIVGQKEL